VNWVLSGLYINETSKIKCNYVYSKTPLKNCLKKQYQKHNVKMKTLYKKGIIVAGRPASRQQYETSCSSFYIIHNIFFINYIHSHSNVEPYEWCPWQNIQTKRVFNDLLIS
jgi:hypothetical protein